MDRGGTNCVGLDFHPTGHRLDRLHARTRNWSALSISRCFERVGDHATNIAKDAVYATTAEDNTY
ncbi:MAG: hypothetical protein DME53_07490 [Verrucomicrobia bacterium]|nr:MAG: hypothetical protein DME53_07490 [Verrucomicrobiota bacterium]